MLGDLSSIPAQIRPVVERMDEEYRKNPPSIALIGLSGVGKSSTINAMFNTNLTVSATTRGTSKFESIRASLSVQRTGEIGKPAFLQVYDAPGLGEDLRLDPEYLQMYEEFLPKCDVILWIIAARNRALALDQHYLERLRPFLDKVVFGINQSDLVDPLDWDDTKNLPSSQQSLHIEAIVKDRSQKISDFLGRKVNIIAYSASRYYRLMDLYQHIIENSPRERRWMFEFVRAFDSSDWLKRATGLSEEEKMRIVDRFGK